MAADTWWLLWNGALVFFMQCGFGMLEVGSVTARSSQNILLKNLLDASLGAIMWWLVGHAIAYDGPNGFFGLVPEARGTMAVQYRAQRDDATDADFAAGGGYDWAFWWFQFTFAAASCTIVSGAVAERAQLLAYLLYSGWITMLIYPVVVHWVWCEAGWLSVGNPDAFLNGVIDFAGSGVVHAVGGTAALVGAAIIGPRRGRFAMTVKGRRGPAIHMRGHSHVLQVLGTMILWLGWYGFNAGSTLSITGSSASTAARVVCTTTLAASTSGMCTVVLERIRGRGKTWDVSAMCNGVLSGLVSITAGCATVTAWAAVLIGAIASIWYETPSPAPRPRPYPLPPRSPPPPAPASPPPPPRAQVPRRLAPRAQRPQGRRPARRRRRPWRVRHLGRARGRHLLDAVLRRRRHRQARRRGRPHLRRRPVPRCAPPPPRPLLAPSPSPLGRPPPPHPPSRPRSRPPPAHPPSLLPTPGAAVVFIICLVLWSGTLSFLIFFSLNKVGYLRHGTEPGAALDDEDGSRHYGVPYDVNAAGDPQKHGVEGEKINYGAPKGETATAAPAQPAEPAKPAGEGI